ncbi:phage tail tip lysozyme [Chitinophaga niabensis]|uniref:phage tail tip lysozyme n=1 Tax=Chitinophaga niabensis TaxID=536979 RepID=UPI0031BBB8DF
MSTPKKAPGKSDQPAQTSSSGNTFFSPVNNFFSAPPVIQKQAATAAPATPAAGSTLSAPLTDSEWRGVEVWKSCGFVGIDPLTNNPRRNAELMAAALFCERALFSREFDERREDPLLCILTDVTIADPRVQTLATHVASRGPILSWEQRTIADPVLYAMERLINEYHFPVNGAAGMVGNLRAESGVIPNRIEGSAAGTPMRAEGSDHAMHDFTPDQIMNRGTPNQVGPLLPGVGIAQWTTGTRRSGLFEHQYCGMTSGANILFNMDAQIDYLVTELQGRFAGVYNTLTNARTSVDAASDVVVKRFEVPGAILNNGALRPDTDPAVVEVLTARRNLSQGAFNAYRAAHP